jgi:DNA polymerase-1
MMKNKQDIFKLLDGIKKEGQSKAEPTFKRHDRVMIIDGLNLFLRNFSMINFINRAGNHIGGLSGFLRSLGSLIKTFEPTEVYVIFDGKGSSTNRKNLIPEYKSGRNITRITNFDIFKNVNDENDSKVNQIVRLIHYLNCLPIKVASMDDVEADDVIAYLAKELDRKHDSKVFIVSADQDYIQLVNKNIQFYSPIIKEIYTPDKVKNKYGVIAENFIIYKTLVGDGSDKITGIKGLGKGKLLTMFPELANKPNTLDEIITKSEKKYKDHILFSKIVFEKDTLKKYFKIMDLHNPLMTDEDKEYVDFMIEEKTDPLDAKMFLELFKEDGLDNTIRTPGVWLNDIFKVLNSIK